MKKGNKKVDVQKKGARTDETSNRRELVEKSAWTDIIDGTRALLKMIES